MNTDLLERLIAAGTPVGLVAEVAAELGRAEAAQRVLDERRAKDRERKRPRNSAESVETAEIQPEPSPLSPQKKNQIPPLNPPTGLSGACAILPPSDIPEDAWDAFVAMRKAKKKPVNDAIAKRIFKLLRELAEAGFPPGEILDRSTRNGWTDVFDPRKRNDRSTARKAYPDKRSGWVAAMEHVGSG